MEHRANILVGPQRPNATNANRMHKKSQHLDTESAAIVNSLLSLKAIRVSILESRRCNLGQWLSREENEVRNNIFCSLVSMLIPSQTDSVMINQFSCWWTEIFPRLMDLVAFVVHARDVFEVMLSGVSVTVFWFDADGSLVFLVDIDNRSTDSYSIVIWSWG